MLLGVVRRYEPERLLHLLQLNLKLLLFLVLLLNGHVLDFEDVLEELLARVDPVEGQSNLSGELSLFVLKLQPLVVLVLVYKHV